MWAPQCHYLKNSTERMEVLLLRLPGHDGYPQHLVVVRSASDGCDEHPHPVPPVDFTSASWAQHALTPAGAGPPQQPLGWAFRDSSELVIVLLVLMALSSSCELPARVHVYGRRELRMDAWERRCGRSSRGCVFSHSGPSLQADAMVEEDR